jgi:hypothetical protein
MLKTLGWISSTTKNCDLHEVHRRQVCYPFWNMKGLLCASSS